MRLNELMDWLAVIFEWTFGILTSLGNGFNVFIIIMMSILGVIWIKKMGDFNKEARQNNTLK
ncbi:MAG: hypothetical protein HN542_10890 [Flavobacteriales bacterium]|jgi:hypothetical protein|nr:hypothetical protein [Flavobacteriales bacterium]NCG29680.1 hypothetical protein [Bacteroidota bacterium]MBT3964635.1 hypothetical protein [Flavobacteriales bacterium]MBT4704405.1 hypothetical protein [Flavobacteriales bacterium]MBT4929484.1 hypothetical protein [Flavobacteriales bacterium]